VAPTPLAFYLFTPGSRCDVFTPTVSGSLVYFGARRFAERVDVQLRGQG
jgi:hypothetical protein